MKNFFQWLSSLFGSKSKKASPSQTKETTPTPQPKKEVTPEPTPKPVEEPPIDPVEVEIAIEETDTTPDTSHQETEEPPVREEVAFPIENMLQFAATFTGVPYLIGGTTPEAFDCSGFVGHVFRQYEVALPRTSSQQSEAGEEVGLTEVRKGDLLFFSHSGDRIQHVGIVVSDLGEPLKMIHASTSKGVITSDVANSSYWKPRIKWARRVIA